MKRAIILAGLLLASGPVLAQEVGGLGLDPGIGDGPHGLARPLPANRNPYFTAHDLQGTTSASDHQTQDQAMITALRGDPGYLAGFAFGTPLAPSRQPTTGLPDDGGFRYRRRHHGNGDGPIIINNQGPLAVTVGNGNVVQQQSASGPGPIAQQQVATTAPGSPGGGALNLVSRAGNIIQRAPRGQ